LGAGSTARRRRHGQASTSRVVVPTKLAHHNVMLNDSTEQSHRRNRPVKHLLVADEISLL
jgi:hypothetical protein